MLNKRLGYLLIILLGLLLFSSTIFFNFTYFDDQDLILNNYQTISQPKNIFSLFTEDVFLSEQNFYYRPLLNLSFMFDAQFSGINAWFYHLSNILFHILAVCLLFKVLLVISKKVKRSFFLSLIFLVHPVFVSAVAWIPGRNDSLLTIFLLASFLSFLYFLKKQKLSNYLYFLLFFLLSIFTKEAAIFWPILILFYSFFLSSSQLKTKEKNLLILGMSAVIFIWFLFRSLAIDGSLGALNEIVLNILNFSPATIVSLGKLFFPFNLGVMSLLQEKSILTGILAILIILFLYYKGKIKKEWLAFGLLWFLLFLLPGFLNPDKTISYQLLLLEHRLYLPAIGIILIFSQFNYNLKNKKLILISALIILSFFSFLTLKRLPYYKSPLSFWQYAVYSTPNSAFAQRNLGVMFYYNGDLEEAKKHYLNALEINPQEPMAHNNLGVIYLEENDLEEAKKEFLLELEVNPGYDKALNNLNNLQDLKNKLR